MLRLEDLGFTEGERVVVVHVDDIGMSEAANSGALRALAATATCGSVMVPCPAFQAIAEIARERPELDLGVHLTLNAEYETHRWGPIRDDVPGLCSPDRGLWRTTAEVLEHASEREVEVELRAQIELALGAGIDVTHIDSHMGTVLHARFVEVYLRLARDYRLPAFLPRIFREQVERSRLGHNLERMRALIAEAQQDGLPVFDGFDADSLHFEPGRGLEHNRARLDGLGVGLSYLITHCAQGGEELAKITPESWRQRAEEADLYSDGSMERELEARGIRTLGMRTLRDWMRSSPSRS